MTTLLLTGASGLVGITAATTSGDSRASTAAHSSGDRSALPPGTTAVRGDLADPGSLRAAVEGIDAVVHLAALFRTDDQDAIWRANLDGTRNLVDAVNRYAPRARFVMASTGNVYDADATRPALETDACSPTAAYPASKVAAEQLLRDSGLTWSILRLPFVYGDGDGHLASLAGARRAVRAAPGPHLLRGPPARRRDRHAPRLDRHHGQTDRERDRRRARHRLRDDPDRRQPDRGISRAPRQPLVRSHGRNACSRARLPPHRAHHPRSSPRRNPLVEIDHRQLVDVQVDLLVNERRAGPTRADRRDDLERATTRTLSNWLGRRPADRSANGTARPSDLCRQGHVIRLGRSRPPSAAGRLAGS